MINDKCQMQDLTKMTLDFTEGQTGTTINYRVASVIQADYQIQFSVYTINGNDGQKAFVSTNVDL